jgi:hypothetical protein
MDSGSATSPATPLNDTGVDFSNETQAVDFLSQILDDSLFQVVDNGFARDLWYGLVVFIGIVAIFNIFQVAARKMRCVRCCDPSARLTHSTESELRQRINRGLHHLHHLTTSSIRYYLPR